MDFVERFNSKFGKWYEGLFGSDGGELRPKDVLRKITAAMEDHRKEGLDGKIYVPNKYVLELAVPDAEERDYLLSFLDEEELVSVLQRFMAQNHYHARGPLDFTIAEAPAGEGDARREKLRVKVRFEKGEMPPPIAPSGAPERAPADEFRLAAPAEVVPSEEHEAPGRRGQWLEVSVRDNGADDLPTVAGLPEEDEPGTVPAVAWAALAVTSADGRKSHFSLTKPVVTIGRSRNAGNDLVLDSDGMVSKVHARLERERDGQWTLFDLGSTNGVKVNGHRIEGNRLVQDGDEVLIGASTLVFQQAGGEDARHAADGDGVPRGGEGPTRRARLLSHDGDAHVLASETLIGRAVTSDVVLTDASVSTRHARIVAPDAATYYLEDLGSERGTRLNGRLLAPQHRTLLADGDTVTFGAVTLRFSGGTR